MNLHVRQQKPTTTQAAEGLQRRAWTADDVEAMVAAGIVAESERIELIGGELVPMSPKGAFHETIKKELNRYWTKRISDATDVLTETTFRLSNFDFLEPDFVFWPRTAGVRGLTPEIAELVIEISDSSLAYDTGRKAEIYASFGIADYWAINARTLITRIHRAPKAGKFMSVVDLPAEAILTPLLLPSLSVSLASLGLTPAPPDAPA